MNCLVMPERGVNLTTRNVELTVLVSYAISSVVYYMVIEKEIKLLALAART